LSANFHGGYSVADAAGAIIAQLIVSTGTSAVLHMDQMRKAEHAHLVSDQQPGLTYFELKCQIPTAISAYWIVELS
jgi:hypothetical protein